MSGSSFFSGGNAVSVEFRGQDAASLFGKAIDARPLSHAERMEIDAAARDATFFSAKVSDAKLLEQMRDYIGRAARGESGFHRGDFVKKMRSAMGVGRDEKISPSAPITDLRSSRRLELIYDFQRERLDAELRAKQAQDPDFAHEYPAQELIRVEEREVPRDWRSRWREAGGKFYRGRMIALRDDPIWAKISRFGSPLPPFDFNSGMGLEDVDRDEAISLGLIKPEETDAPVAESRFSNYPGSEELPESRDLPKTEALEKASRNVAMPPRPEKIETVADAKAYAETLLSTEERKRTVDFSLATTEQAKTVMQSIENAKKAGLLDAAGVTKITIVEKIPGTYGRIDRKAGTMEITKSSFEKNDGRTTPIHEVVHMFNAEIKADPKLEKELVIMHNGYKKKAAGVRGKFPPLDAVAEHDAYEFLSDAVSYYLCGGNVRAGLRRQRQSEHGFPQAQRAARETAFHARRVRFPQRQRTESGYPRSR